MFLRAWDVQHPNTDGNLPVALHEGGLDLRPRPRGAATGAGRAHRAPTRRGLPVPAAIYTAGAGWGQTVRFFGWVWTHQCSVKALFPLYKQQLSKLHNDENRPLRTDSLAQKNAYSATYFAEREPIANTPGLRHTRTEGGSCGSRDGVRASDARASTRGLLIGQRTPAQRCPGTWRQRQLQRHCHFDGASSLPTPTRRVAVFTRWRRQWNEKQRVIPQA